MTGGNGHDGKLIVFEGIDGAGTTTQAARYGQHLRERRRLVHLTREPSDGPIGSSLRLALTGRMLLGASHQAQMMALLFAADRLDHIAHEIGPHLRDGYVVLCDRYDLSSIVYQTATTRTAGDDFERWVREVNRYALRPDATVIIDVAPAEAERRRRERSRTPDLYEDSELQARLAQLYLRAEELVPGDPLIRVDGNAPADEVTAAILAKLHPIVG